MAGRGGCLRYCSRNDARGVDFVSLVLHGPRTPEKSPSNDCPWNYTGLVLLLLLQLATPILSMLDGSPNAWLGSMMQAFNMGDIDAFNKLCSENQEVTLRSDTRRHVA